jgi:hypothetical protein
MTPPIHAARPVRPMARSVARRLPGASRPYTLRAALKSMKIMNKLILLAAIPGLLATLPARAIEAYRLAPSDKIVLGGNLDDSGWARAATTCLPTRT